MPAKQNSLSTIDKLERDLARLLPAEKNIIRRKKNGDIIYETVRPHYAPTDHEHSTEDTNPKRERGTNPNFYTETPDSAQNGQQFDPLCGPSIVAAGPTTVSEVVVGQGVAAHPEPGELNSNDPAT